LPPSDQSAFHREVARRFGLVPHFFLSARDDPEIIEKLWGFAAFTGATISGWCRSTVFFPIFRLCCGALEKAARLPRTCPAHEA
jgi:hypothetical protein